MSRMVERWSNVRYVRFEKDMTRGVINSGTMQCLVRVNSLIEVSSGVTKSIPSSSFQSTSKTKRRNTGNF